jgi:hypothetical protein
MPMTSKSLMKLTPGMLKLVTEQHQIANQLVKIWQRFEYEVEFPPGQLPKLREGVFDDAAHVLCLRCRQLLAVPTTQDEIMIAVTVLHNSMKWPGRDVIPLRNEFLYRMIQHLVEHEYPTPVLAQAAMTLPEQYEWFPSIKQVIEACDAAKFAMWHGIRYLEAPAEERLAIAYQVRVGALTKQQAARELRILERERRERELLPPSKE